MAFEVPASKASIKQNRFEFTIGGKEFSIPKAKFLDMGIQEVLENPESSTALLDALFGPRGTKLGDAIRTIDQDGYEALMEAWKADSGIGLGESEVSSS